MNYIKIKIKKRKKLLLDNLIITAKTDIILKLKNSSYKKIIPKNSSAIFPIPKEDKNEVNKIINNIEIYKI